MNENSQVNISLNLEDLKPLRDKIASSIRESILTGKLKPGERLMELDLANQLGISRTPVREAFLQLESEGFVQVIPRKGAVVTETSFNDAKETYEIKSVLEGLAAKLATSFLTEEQIDELVELNNQMKKISKTKEKDYQKFLQLNSKFHKIINESCGNSKLIKLIHNLRHQTFRYNYLFLSLISHLEHSVQEHEKIIMAIKKRNQNLVEELVKRHNENAKEALIKFIKNKNP
ncbi:MAG: GntR family transcriptional regulator [Ignavibacteria bacterium]|jgi:DNA-binding GntR family transcriptional regulator|nr:GntR family transcriptional regulator [Ignavibacteria bacterium]MDH7527682.1 GntR family transcriptional regulator [Ignavibacteria bacterium]NPV10920.1 GntR family transcriptional regulator [Ignavibacteria bacterium]